MVNKVILVGNLGADPEIKYTKSGTTVANLSVATADRKKDQSGQYQDVTEWHRCVAWSRLAEICGEYLQKGSQVYIEGKLETRKWQDQSGNDRYTTEIVVREMKMLGGKSNNRGSNREEYGGGGENRQIGEDVPF